MRWQSKGWDWAWVVREGFLEEVSWVLKDRLDNERMLWVWVYQVLSTEV